MRAMGGLGSHALHPYALQAIAFSFSLLIPGGVFALLGAAWLERHQRTSGQKAAEALASWQAAERR